MSAICFFAMWISKGKEEDLFGYINRIFLLKMVNYIIAVQVEFLQVITLHEKMVVLDKLFVSNPILPEINLSKFVNQWQFLPGNGFNLTENPKGKTLNYYFVEMVPHDSKSDFASTQKIRIYFLFFFLTFEE